MFKDALDRLHKKIEDLESTKPYDNDLCHKYLYILVHFTLFFIEVLVLVSILYFTSMSILLILNRLWVWFSFRPSLFDGINKNYKNHNNNNQNPNSKSNCYTEENKKECEEDKKESEENKEKEEENKLNKKYSNQALRKKMYGRHNIVLSEDGDHDLHILHKHYYNNVQNYAHKNDRNLGRLDDFRHGSSLAKAGSFILGKTSNPHINTCAGVFSIIINEAKKRSMVKKGKEWPKSSLTKKLDKHSPFREDHICIKNKKTITTKEWNTAFNIN